MLRMALTSACNSSMRAQRASSINAVCAVGHASVIIVLGIGAIALGATVPDWLDAIAGRIVGVTLIVLGGLVAATLVLERGRFKARSRWMILFDVSRKIVGATKARYTHSHEHVAIGHAHHDGDEDDVDGTSRITAPTHDHAHEHAGDGEYTNRVAVGIGAIHGIGAETPTQVVVFLAAASAGGVWAGLVVLFTFVLGLIVSNSAITVASVHGFSMASRSQAVQIGFGVFTAVMSIGIGILFLTGTDAILPAFFAG